MALARSAGFTDAPVGTLSRAVRGQVPMKLKDCTRIR